MELRHLRYFVAVAEELHFGHAASRLHVSQPSLSQQIQNLERELKMGLLRRTRRHVELTPAGRGFLQEARGILAAAERAGGLAREMARNESQKFAIGISPDTDWLLLGKGSAAVRAYRRLMRQPVAEPYEEVPSWAQAVKGDEAFADRVLQAVGEAPVVPRGLTIERIAREVARAQRVRPADMVSVSRGRGLGF